MRGGAGRGIGAIGFADVKTCIRREIGSVAARLPVLG